MAAVPCDSARDAPESLDIQELIDAHGNRLLRSAYLLCGDETEAQDLIQETLVQAIKSFSGFRGESAIYTWLHGILLNLCRRHYRKQKRFVYDEERILEEPFQPETTNDLDQNFQASELAKSIQKLSPEHREVVVLRYFENMKIEEIARQTGTSKGTVKSRLHYAVRDLKRLVPNTVNLFDASGTNHPATP